MPKLPSHAAGREPPAYQEFASTILASRQFRLLNAAERGIFYTMRLECWANKSLPADPAKLATVIGLPGDAVADALPALMYFFVAENGEIRCPELDQYRAHLEHRRTMQSSGGKAGSAATNAKRNNKNQQVNGESSTSSSTSSSRGRVLSTVQHNTTKSNPVYKKPLSNHAAWIAEYDAAETSSADAYRAAKEGQQ